jgi:ATP-binding protein involved in chromosome partitioning
VAEPTKEQVLEALSKVQDPELGKDIVSLGMVKGMEIQGPKLWVDVELTTPACPLKDQIHGDINAAVAPLGFSEPVEVNWSAQVAHARGPDGDLQPGVRNVIAVASGKGGVGKSTVAVNLAAALAREGAKTGLMDVDIYGPSIPMMTGTGHVRGGDVQLIEGRIQPLEAHGLKLLSMGYLVPPERALVWRGPMLHKAINQFFSDVDWGDLDYLVLDLPPGTGDVQLSLAQIFPLTGAVLVTTPQPVAIADVIKGAHMFQQVNVPLLGVIENMSHYLCPSCGHDEAIFARGGGRNVCAEQGWPFLGEIPIDPSIRVGGDEGVPVVVSHPDSPVAAAFGGVARALAGKVSQAVLGEISV